MKPKDLLQLVLLAALIWFSVIAPRISQPEPPIISAGPTAAPFVIEATAPPAWTPEPAYIVDVIEPNAALTATPGPTLNEFMGQPADGDLFGGNYSITEE